MSRAMTVGYHKATDEGRQHGPGIDRYFVDGSGKRVEVPYQEISVSRALNALRLLVQQMTYGDEIVISCISKE